MQAQSFDRLARERCRAMLKDIRDTIRKDYYDPTFRGMDLEVRFKEADEMLKQATSLGQAFGIIAQVLVDLDDPHTLFIPPQRMARIDYGWQIQMIGDTCHVVAVKPGSDAEAKGLKAGDIVQSVGGFAPTRSDLWKIKYLYYTLRPQPGLRIVAQSPGGAPRQLDLAAKVQQSKLVFDLTGARGNSDIWELIRNAETEGRLRVHRYYDAGDDLIIWKMPQFDTDAEAVHRMMDKVRKKKALILDLRGNAGGSVSTLEQLAGYFFDRDLKIADLKGRKEMKPIVAETRGGRTFKGKLVVLVDSESASASELFARLVQLEKRGTVIGDRTAGAVMRAKYYARKMGLDTVIFYAMSITDADVIMSDGKSLETVGVTPDVLLLPTAADLAAQRDPLLAHAAQLVGIEIDPETAGLLFPIEWEK